MENRNPMEYKPVFPLLMSMAIPPMISMLIQSLYNIIDSIFVSQLGEEANSSIIDFPFTKFIISYFLWNRDCDECLYCKTFRS